MSRVQQLAETSDISVTDQVKLYIMGIWDMHMHEDCGYLFLGSAMEQG